MSEQETSSVELTKDSFRVKGHPILVGISTVAILAILAIAVFQNTKSLKTPPEKTEQPKEKPISLQPPEPDSELKIKTGEWETPKEFWFDERNRALSTSFSSEQSVRRISQHVLNVAKVIKLYKNAAKEKGILLDQKIFVEIEGHTDSTGWMNCNQHTSEQEKEHCNEEKNRRRAYKNALQISKIVQRILRQEFPETTLNQAIKAILNQKIGANYRGITLKFVYRFQTVRKITNEESKILASLSNYYGQQAKSL